MLDTNTGIGLGLGLGPRSGTRDRTAYHVKTDAARIATPLYVATCCRSI